MNEKKKTKEGEETNKHKNKGRVPERLLLLQWQKTGLKTLGKYCEE